MSDRKTKTRRLRALACRNCGHEFREDERRYTLVETPMSPQLSPIGRGKDVDVCKHCFLDIAAEEEDEEDYD